MIERVWLDFKWWWQVDHGRFFFIIPAVFFGALVALFAVFWIFEERGFYAVSLITGAGVLFGAGVFLYSWIKTGTRF